MHLFETLRTSVRSLLSNKTRSALTMLGVVIGTAAVIAMVALGAGANRGIQRFITGVGSNLLLIHPAAASVGGARQQAGRGASNAIHRITAAVSVSLLVREGCDMSRG